MRLSILTTAYAPIHYKSINSERADLYVYPPRHQRILKWQNLQFAYAILVSFYHDLKLGLIINGFLLNRRHFMLLLIILTLVIT